MYRQLLIIGTGLFLLLAGCNKAPYIPYHSTAGIEHQTRMVQTEMNLINSESNETSTLSYAVIAALDNEELPYILIAPAKSSYSTEDKELWNYNISYSTTIHPDKAKDLVNSLELILKKWNSNQQTKEGYFFEFMHTPQHKIFRKSEDVVAEYPSIRVNFNLTEKGSSGSLVIGEGELKYMYTFEERRDVQRFHDLLEDGLNKLIDMDT